MSAQRLSTPMETGRRVAVVGVTGSGKTTFSRRLAAIIGVKAIELDDIFWLPDWVSRSRAEFRVKVIEALAAHPDGWVSDGNYRTALGNLLLHQADTVVWLHLPWRLTFWRVLRRCIFRARTGEAMWTAQNRESWRRMFLNRDSLLFYSTRQHRRASSSIRERFEQLPPHIACYELRSPREVEAFLEAVTAGRAAKAAAI